MAYVDDSLEQNDSSKSNTQANDNSPVVPGGGGDAKAPSVATVNSGSGTPAAGSVSAGAASQGKLPSNNFPDIANYLKVNSGQNFGAQLAGKVGDQIDQSSANLNSAADQFKQRADSATVTDKNNLTGQVGTDPTQVDPNAYKSLLTASYQGPNNFQDASDLYSQGAGGATAAIDQANASKTEGGRFSLLDNYFNTPTYSQGQKSLDNLLVQADPNSQQAFSQIQQNADALKSNLGTTTQALGQYATNAAGTTQATNDAARAALGIDAAGNEIVGNTGALGNAENQIASNVTNAQTQQTADDAAIQSAFTNNDFSKLTDAQRSIIGLAPGANKFDSLYGVDGSKFLSNSAVNASNAATPQQYADYNALTNLAGLQNTLLTDPSQATAPTKYDFSALQNAIGAGKQAYGSQVDTVNKAYTDQVSQAKAAINDLANQYGALSRTTGVNPNAHTYLNAQGQPIGNYQQAQAYYQNQIQQAQAAQTAALYALDKQYGVNGAVGVAPSQSPAGNVAGGSSATRR